MAIKYVSTEGTLIKPGAYASYKVITEPTGFASTGVVTLIGEAETGPAAWEEEDITENWFGPDQLARVRAKYTAGPVVDAFVNATTPSTDADIAGAPTRIYILKTNAGAKGTAELLSGNPAEPWAEVVSKLAGPQFMTVAVERKVDESVAVTPLFGMGDTDGTVTVLVNGESVEVEVDTTSFADFVASFDAAGLQTIEQDEQVRLVATSASGGATVAVLDPDGATTLGASANRVFTATTEPSVRIVTTSGQEEFVVEAGGAVALLVGSTAEGAKVTVGDNGVTLTSQGAAPVEFDFASTPTVAQLVEKINTVPTWKAKVGSAAARGYAPSALDQGEYAAEVFNTETAGYTACIKADAAAVFAAMAASPFMTLAGEPATGLPAAQPTTVLAGGKKGGTTQEDYMRALELARRIRTNFIIPLFSADATVDIADGLTDTSSTYEIEGIAHATLAHAHDMAKLKVGRPRQVILSYWGTYTDTKALANDLGSQRSAVAFSEVVAQGADGRMKWFRPWMGALKAGTAQAAAGRNAIFNKAITLTGFRHPEFSSDELSMVEDALENGLLVLERTDEGNVVFVSDQTTYGTDENFVFNSIQAVYAADTVAVTLRENLHRRYVGRSIADVSASSVRSFVEQLLLGFYNRRYIASSDDGAPYGFKNVAVQVNGPVIEVSLEIKLAGAIYFIPISIAISTVTQSA